MASDTADRSQDIAALDAAFEANARAARAVVDGMDERTGTWRADPASWSVAECLDHLAVAHRVYLAALQPAAERAAARGRARRRPVVPGLIGGWFVRFLEPPVKKYGRARAPQAIRPRVGPSLADASARFFAAHEEVRAFLARYAAIDLAGVPFPNPFIRGVRFSLATGVHVLAAHERRHLWQARHVRTAALAAAAASVPPSVEASAARAQPA